MVYSKGQDIILFSKTEQINCKIGIYQRDTHPTQKILTKDLMTYLNEIQSDPGDTGI